ncbi:hypothetical protein JCM10207_004762 [Rhodosporidiobolus poonsookiae]
MLDQLPTELVEAILEHLLPPVEPVWDARYIPDDLIAASRTCTSIRAVARPLIWCEVKVQSATGSERLLDLLTDGTASDMFDAVRVVRGLDAVLARALALEAPADLRALWLFYLRIEPVTIQYTFANLVELSLTAIEAVGESLSSLLSTASLPALRALALLVSDDLLDDPPFPTLSDPFLAQLELLQLYSPDAALIPPALLRSTSTPVVFIVVPDDEKRAEYTPVASRHAAILGDPAKDEEIAIDLGMFCRPAFPLDTLHLPIRLHPSRFFDAVEADPTKAGVLASIEATLAACVRNGTEVLWLGQATERTYAVAPELWRWAKKLKAKLALEAGGGSGASEP